MKIYNFGFMMILILSAFTAESQSGFRESQLKFERVKKAFEEKEANINLKLKNAGFSPAHYSVFIRVIKNEASMEVFIAAKSTSSYKKVFGYKICSSSGVLGPKRKEGDAQVPEGFYHIGQYNPFSNYWLSMGINYPNAVDRVLADANHPGGNIFIHGNCVSIGCMPITDEGIKELYVLCVKAKSLGQSLIPVHIFPFRMTDEEMKKQSAGVSKETMTFWNNLKDGYQKFDKTQKIPEIRLKSGGYYQYP